MNLKFTLAILVCLLAFLEGRPSRALTQSAAEFESRMIKDFTRHLEESAEKLRVTTLEEYQKEHKDKKVDEGRSNKKIGLIVLIDPPGGFLGGSSAAYFLDGKLVGSETFYSLFVFATPMSAANLAKSLDETLKKNMYVTSLAVNNQDKKYVQESDSHLFKKYTIKRGAETIPLRTVIEVRTFKSLDPEFGTFRVLQIRQWDETAADNIKTKLEKAK